MAQKQLNFHQIQIQYSPEEDRIVMRLNSTDKEQYAMAFTRRFVMSFWPALVQVLSSDPNFSSYDQKTQKAAMEFQHQDVISKADYEKPFDNEDMTFPWGEAPLLAYKAIIKTPQDSLKVLGIYDKNNVGLEFAGNHHVLHYLYKGIMDLNEQVGWHIDLQSLLSDAMQIDKGKLN